MIIYNIWDTENLLFPHIRNIFNKLNMQNIDHSKFKNTFIIKILIIQ